MTNRIWGILAAFAALVVGLANPGAAQQFVLEVPDQLSVRSSAVIDGNGLVITDSSGKQFVYVRQRELDDATGGYLGFHCREAQRYIRWPAAGRGAMYLGELSRGAVVWQPSKMRIRSAAPAPTSTVVRRPVLNGRGSTQPMSNVPVRAGPVFVDAITGRNGNDIAAYIDNDGVLQFYANRQDHWRPVETNLRDRLSPGAPVMLRHDQVSDVPTTYSIDRRGQLMEITAGNRLRTWPQRSMPSLAPNGHLTSFGNAALTVDSNGQLWELGLDGRGHQPLDRQTGLYVPGSRVASLRADGEHVFAIDRAGNLMQYHSARNGSWRAPSQIGHGFAPGGWVEAAAVRTAAGRADFVLSSVDRQGRLQLLRFRDGTWRATRVGDVLLSPGAPVALSTLDHRIGVSAISHDGNWRQWRYYGGQWTAQRIAMGFAVGAPVYMFGRAGRAFAVDRLGRLVAAGYHDNSWHCAVCTPGFSYAPDLVSRRIVPNPPLPPAEVELFNRHNEPLVARIADGRQPGRLTEVKISPGEGWKYRFDRDPGGVLEEVFLVPVGLGVVEKTYRYPLPPQQIYDVVVYVDRVTSVYFDRTKNKTDTPDSVGKSLVSLGVFPIPPGNSLRVGQRLDVYGEAKRQNNAGGAAWFGRP